MHGESELREGQFDVDDVTGHGGREETMSMGRKVNNGRRIGLVSLLAAGMMSLGIVGCGGGSTQENVGPGVIFNNVIAGDFGGQLKVVFPGYGREPAMEQPRAENENFMIEVHPAWSPDGEKIAFTRTVGEEGMALFIRTSLGHPEAEAHEAGAAIGTPVWSATSDQVAYLAMTGGTAEGEGKPAEGEKKAEATPELESEKKAEGEKTAEEGEKPLGLSIVGTDGKDPRLIVKGEAEPVGWSDSGIYYAYGIYGMRDLRVVDPDGKNRRVVYAAPGAKFVGEATLSSDGGRMAMEVVSPDESSVLLVRDLRSGRVTQVTRTGRVSDLEWASNGRSLVFVWTPGSEKSGRVMTYKVGESRPLSLTRQPGKYRSPSWAADGTTVAFVKDGDIYVQKVGTSVATRTTKSGDAADIVWSPK